MFDQRRPQVLTSLRFRASGHEVRVHALKNGAEMFSGHRACEHQHGEDLQQNEEIPRWGVEAGKRRDATAAAAKDRSNPLPDAAQPRRVPPQLGRLNERDDGDHKNRQQRHEVRLPTGDEHGTDHRKREHCEEHRVLQPTCVEPDEPDEDDPERMHEREQPRAPSSARPRRRRQSGKHDMHAAQRQHTDGRASQIDLIRTEQPRQHYGKQNRGDRQQPDIVQQMRARIAPRRRRQ